MAPGGGVGETGLQEVQDTLNLMQHAVAMIEQAQSNLHNERIAVRAERENLQTQLDEAARLKNILLKQHEVIESSGGFLACCSSSPTAEEVESEARRAVRKVADRAAAKAFVNVAQSSGVKELTAEDLREIEGDDAEAVIAEAGGGRPTITLKEYRRYKRHQALEKMSLKKYGKKLAAGQETLEENEEDWMCDASYEVGQEVQVLRSDGTWEPCEILIVDRSSIEPFYVVQLQNGMTKEVDENMLYVER